MRRAAPWALALGLTGCIDVPALSFDAPPDSGAADAAGSDTAPRPDALPGAPDGRPNPADARGSSPDARPDAPDRGADSDAAVNGDAAPVVADALKPPPDAPLAVDARAPDPDATVAPRPDAFVPPPGFDAFVPPPGFDAFVPPPDFDAFVPPPDFDAFVPPPVPDAFVPPPVPDAVPPPVPDMAPPPLPDAVPPPVPDMAPPVPDAAPPLPDAAVPPPGIVVVPRNVPGVVAGRRFGATVVIVPDQNGDGFADVVVGAPRTNNNGAATSALYLLDGVTGAELSHYFERDEPDDFGASLVAGPFAAGAPGWQVIVGAGTSNNGRGAIFAHELPGLGQVDTVTGPDVSGRFGTALAVAHDGAQLLALASEPGTVFPVFPRVLYYRLRFDVAGGWNLDRHARVMLGLFPGGNFGANVLGLPPAQAGDVDDFAAVVEAVIPTNRRVVRIRNGSPAPLRSEYVPSNPDMTTGASLLEIPFAPSMLAVGTPGRGNGLVSVFVREAGMAEDPILELTPLERASQFGASLALAPLLSTAEVASPVLCVGAPGAAPAVPGEVECRGIGAESNLVTLTAPPGASGFGRTLAVATARDPDGTWLIVVGAPDTSGPNGALGGLVLHRVTSPP